jgi:nucleoside phosphorylase
MEGFGVALACHAAGIPLAIVRGISNRAGDRRVSSWAISPALQAAAELAIDVLKTIPRGAG